MVFLSQWQNTNEYGDRILTGTAVTGHGCFYHRQHSKEYSSHWIPATPRLLTSTHHCLSLPYFPSPLPQVKPYCKGCRCCAPNTPFLPESETDSGLFLPGKWDQHLEENKQELGAGPHFCCPLGIWEALGKLSQWYYYKLEVSLGCIRRTCLQDKRKQNRTEVEAATAWLRVCSLGSADLSSEWRRMRMCGCGKRRRRVLLWRVATLVRVHTALIQHWP